MAQRKRRQRADLDSRAADEALLANRLRGLGIQLPIAVHENRTVLVSFGRSGVLRVHRGYAYGSDRTLKAIVEFAHAKTRARRSLAEKEILSFQVDRFVTHKRERRRKAPSRRDREIIRALDRLHHQLNKEHFAGALSNVGFRISNRMRRRLGEVTIDSISHSVKEMTISRLHIERDAWTEVRKTVLHEMIHQWQAEGGYPVDHGRRFRTKAKEIGVAPFASRKVDEITPVA